MARVRNRPTPVILDQFGSSEPSPKLRQRKSKVQPRETPGVASPPAEPKKRRKGKPTKAAIMRKAQQGQPKSRKGKLKFDPDHPVPKARRR